MHIRKYEKRDLPAMLELIRELAIFEKAPGKVQNTVAQMEKEMDCFDSFVAENEQGEVVGMALYFFAYYTWVGKSLYLDDLIVRSDHRGQGIGSSLFEFVIQEAQEQDCKRMRWQVLDWNRQAIDLYEKYRCDIEKGWLNCDLSFI